MNIAERARGAALRAIGGKFEPWEESNRRFRRHLDSCSDEVFKTVTKASRYIQDHPGSDVPQDLTSLQDRLLVRYRELRDMEVRGIRPRNVEIKLFSRPFTVTVFETMKKVRRQEVIG